MKRTYSRMIAAGLVALTSLVANGQNALAENDGEIEAVKAAIQSYSAAFHAKDVKTLVSHWLPEGVYISRNSGERVSGHAALTTEFNSIFEGGRVPELTNETKSVQLISPNVALERGTARVTRADGEMVESDYRIVYVKSGGRWLIDRVTDEEVVPQLSNYEQLKDLEWLVGEWIEDSDDVAVEVVCNWTRNQNFLSRTYKVSSEEGIESSGLQVIGWDPKEKRIRSWLFDSNGGFVSGVWSKRDGRWVVQAVATLSDGSSGSFTSVFQPIDDATYSWKKINRVVDGRLLPNIDEVVVRRK